jgi:hypothetical protein
LDMVARRRRAHGLCGPGRLIAWTRNPAVEFFPHWFELGVAEPLVAVARHATDAINFQCVERIGDFFQALIDYGNGGIANVLNRSL